MWQNMPKSVQSQVVLAWILATLAWNEMAQTFRDCSLVLVQLLGEKKTKQKCRIPFKMPRRNGPWKSMDIHGISWTFMNVHEVKTQHFFGGNPWTFIGINGCQRIFMDFHRKNVAF